MVTPIAVKSNEGGVGEGVRVEADNRVMTHVLASVVHELHSCTLLIHNGRIRAE